MQIPLQKASCFTEKALHTMTKTTTIKEILLKIFKAIFIRKKECCK